MSVEVTAEQWEAMGHGEEAATREFDVMRRHIDTIAAMLTEASWGGHEAAPDDGVFRTWVKMREWVREHLAEERKASSRT